MCISRTNIWWETKSKIQTNLNTKKQKLLKNGPITENVENRIQSLTRCDMDSK